MKNLTRTIVMVAFLIMLAGVYQSFGHTQFYNPSISRSTLAYYLNQPNYATAATYNTHDDAGNSMDIPSIMDFNYGGYKYVAVYHVYISQTNSFKVAEAVSNDLVNWHFVRFLIDNASMPKIIVCTGAAPWVVIAHEEWIGGGAARVAFKLFYDKADLYAGTIRSTYVAPQFSTATIPCDGTPSFYNFSCNLQADGYYACDGQIGFHYLLDGSRDVNAVATVTKVFDPIGGTGWYPASNTNYNSNLTNAGSTGGIGDRDTVQVTGGRFNVQEGNIGQPNDGSPDGPWEDWRIWFYTFDSGEPSYADGSGYFAQLSPATPNGSTSFGCPCVNFVVDPNDPTKTAIVISYFLFYPGCGLGEAGSLIYYYGGI